MKYIIVFSLFMAGIFLPSCAFANTDADIVTRIINEFTKQSDMWYGEIKSFTLNLFLTVATFEVAYLGIKASLDTAEIKDTLKNFTYMVLSSGFFLACIENYQEWSTMLLRGLYSLAGQMTTIETNSSDPFQLGLELVKLVMIRTEALDWTELGLILSMYIASFIMLICFSLITAKIIVIKCESIIAMMVAVLLLPLGASSLFREYAINSLRYVLSVAFKLFALQLVIGIGFNFLDNIRLTEVNMMNVAVILGFVVVLLAISQTIPEIIAGLINGSSTGTGTGLKGATAMAGALAGGAIGGAVGGSMAVGRASQIARASGAKGVGGTIRGTVGAMRSAQHQANVRRTSMATEIKDRLNTIKELKKG